MKQSQLNEILKKIHMSKAVAYSVGGTVIDNILGIDSKDLDIEVFGITLKELRECLDFCSVQYKEVGEKFGVIKFSVDGIDIDMSIPRTENKIGVKHQDFDIQLNPFLSISEACKRRDLTINSMCKSLLDGSIHDPYGGLKDLFQGVIKHTDDKTFIEDPLRVLRIMQLLPRKGKIVSPDTIKICKSMSDKFNTISKERVFEEFNKLLLKADKPSMGLEFLRECDWIQHFPELNNLIGCEQNPKWHPEGDVWIHTMMVLDNAAKLRKHVPENKKLAYMYAALLHDIGKPATTTLELKSPGHAEHGANLTFDFMNRITNTKDLINDIVTMVNLHMRPSQLFLAKAGVSAWKRLHKTYNLEMLGWLSKADSAGRTGRTIEDYHEPSLVCFTYNAEFGVLEKIVKGADLIELGFKPSPLFTTILDYAYNLQLDGENDKKSLICQIKSKFL